MWFATDTAAVDRCADLMAEDGMTGLNISADHLAGLALAGLAISVNPGLREHRYSGWR